MKLSMIAATLGVAALTLTACGGAKHVSQNGGPDPARNQDQMLKFAQCLRQHGIQVDDPQNGKFTLKDDKQNAGKMDAAQAACRKYAPAGQMNANDPKLHDQLVKGAACLRSKGIQVADPLPGQPLKLQPTVAPDVVEKAMQACKINGPVLQQRGAP